MTKATTAWDGQCSSLAAVPALQHERSALLHDGRWQTKMFGSRSAAPPPKAVSSTPPWWLLTVWCLLNTWYGG